VVWGVAAVARAGDQASVQAAGVEEFPRPELVMDVPAPADPRDDHPLLPCRKRVAPQPDGPREPAGLPDSAGASVPVPRAVEAGGTDDGTGQSMFTARPDINVLAQVLQGLRRMA
jgi:hypothetical protein